MKTDVICDMCGFIASNEGHLRTHMGSQKCTKDKFVLRCDKCDYQTKFEPNLKKHKRTVHEKVPCIVCGKLIAKVRVTIHMNLFHTEDKKRPFVCKVCGKGFADKKTYGEHSNIHTGERPFKCDLCEKTFASSGNMYMHRRSSHYGYKRTK